jgi:hypothetical protein
MGVRNILTAVRDILGFPPRTVACGGRWLPPALASIRRRLGDFLTLRPLELPTGAETWGDSLPLSPSPPSVWESGKVAIRLP